MSLDWREGRNILESTIYYLETNLNNDWSNINICRSFVEAYKLSLPVISVDLSDVEVNRKELGSTSIIKDYVLNIDIFATSHALRLDLTDYIIEKINSEWNYYEYVHTDSVEAPTKTAVGKVHLNDLVENTLVDIGETVHKNDKYRQSIEIIVRKSID